MPPSDASPGEVRTRWRLRWILALVLLSTFVSTCLLYYLSSLYVRGASGRVAMVENLEAPKESWRLIPAPETEVLIIWRAQVLVSNERDIGRCLRRVVTRTDENGEFEVAGRWRAPSWPPVTTGVWTSHPIKRGYYSEWNFARPREDADYTLVLGPSPKNPWSDDPWPDENPEQITLWMRCPPLERL